MRAAGDLARATASRGFRHWTKGADRSPVSEADIAVNDLLRERLTRLVPGAGWLSEEAEEVPRAAGKARALGPAAAEGALAGAAADAGRLGRARRRIVLRGQP